MDENLDIPALSADFARDITGAPDNGGDGENRDTEAGPSVAAPVPSPAPAIDPVAELLKEYPLPKSWKKDLEPVWVKGDRELLKQVLNREGEMSRGIQMYQQGYSNWDNTLSPFKEVLARQPEFTTQHQVQLLQNLMTSHLRMLGLQGAEKHQFATQLLKAYGLSPQDLIGPSQSGNPSAPPPPAIPPELLAKMQQLEAQTSSFNSYLEQRELEKVNAFFDDPKNEFANEVAPDLISILKAEPGLSLAEAYEKAIWLNPSVRAKVQEKEFAERTRKAEEKAAEIKRLNNLNRKGSDGTPSSKHSSGKKSVDETIDEIVSKHTSTH